MDHSPLSLKDRLHEAGFRVTESRLAIAELLEHAHQPVSTLALAEALVPKMLDLATLYRTLNAFKEKELVRQVNLDARFASYEWVEDAHEHHHHLVCQSCGLIEEIPECELTPLETRILKRSEQFAQIESHSLEFFGTCKTCVKKVRR